MIFPQKRLRTFLAFAGLPSVTIEDRMGLSKALAWTAAGLDFEVALHLAKSATCTTFATFDRTFAKRATRIGAGKVELAR